MILSLSPWLVTRTGTKWEQDSLLTSLALGTYYSAILFYFVLSLLMLRRKLPLLQPYQKNQVLIIMFSIGIIITLNLIEDCILSPLGLENWVTNMISGLSFAIFGGGTAYAMVRHRFFDVRSAVARSVTYTLLLLMGGAIYGLLAINVSHYLFRSQNSISAHLYTLLVAVLILVSLSPLKKFFDKITNRLFYRDAFDVRSSLSELTKGLANVHDSATIAQISLKTLDAAIKPAGAHMLLTAGGVLVSSSSRYKVPVPAAAMLEYFCALNEPLFYDQTTDSRVLVWLESVHSSLAWPIIHDSAILGVVFLGEKRSGSTYSRADLKLLAISTDTIALSLQNALQFSEIKAFTDRLEREIVTATAQLRTSNRHLAEASELKEEFISMASHQLRPQLTALSGFVDLLTMKQVMQNPKEQGEILRLMKDGSTRMMRLVADMLHSGMDESSFGTAHDAFDMTLLVKKEVQALKSFAKIHQIKLQCTHLPKSKVIGDQNKTREALLNLLENAVKYSLEGSVVMISIKITRKYCEVSIADTGIGIVGDDLTHIFTKFGRTLEAKNRNPTGTGIGLFVAKKFIEAQNGSIGVVSKPGKGSRFWFRLPVLVE